MMFELVVNFKRELEEKANQLALHNGEVKNSYEQYLMNIGRVQGIKDAQEMFKSYLRKLNTDDDD